MIIVDVLLEHLLVASSTSTCMIAETVAHDSESLCACERRIPRSVLRKSGDLEDSQTFVSAYAASRAALLAATADLGATLITLETRAVITS